ncbi:MAG TPA: prolyl oligopeptidase family serine peptidase [Verrucomicrobiota bacterium]|nr:MAG: Alpha/beta hydrolase family protein [Verrucomicrobia bacterium ADurb.Bin118]HPY30327.1 prolyl oligopeptidase family serine peptidase [Verrucomicrobiota bacterium]HQB16980.1 prolyl oligopeptidase family serine peptidase [Verrucomicrobiota bacterium]
MKTTALFLSAFGLLPLMTSMPALAQSPSSPLIEASVQLDLPRQTEMRYLVYLPPDYHPAGGTTWPLMLFLHGAGERGTNLSRVAIHGPPSLVKQGTNFPFLIVAPQCPEGQRWENDPLVRLLDHVTRQYAVDPSRIYLTGLSMGGYGTWKLGLTYPEKFAALVPICGGGEFIDALLVSRDKPAAFKSLPVWAFHGAKDPVVPLDESKRMVNLLRKLGVAEVKFTVYPKANHNSWAETYLNPELYTWLLKHRRAGAKP